MRFDAQETPPYEKGERENSAGAVYYDPGTIHRLGLESAWEQTREAGSRWPFDRGQRQARSAVWWRRRELNPGPKIVNAPHLHV